MNALDSVSINVAEAIPYKNFKERCRLVNQELKKNRHVEVLDKPKVIYSTKKWEDEKNG
jgi:hypothetical protein